MAPAKRGRAVRRYLVVPVSPMLRLPPEVRELIVDNVSLDSTFNDG